MITKIKLQNWRSHLDTELTFSRGVNALIGIMGSGKSSITEAISFGLFGTSPLLHSKKLTIDEMISTKPNPQSKGYVEIEFVSNGKRYTVHRAIEKGKTTEAELRQDGQLVESGTAAVTREVERILGLDYELFSRAIYSEQNGLDHFLTMSKGNRTEHIDRMLKLDRFERAREAAVTLTNRIRQKREQMIRWINQLESEGLEKRIESVEKEIEFMLKKREQLSSERLKLLDTISQLSNQLSVFEEKEKLLHRIEKDIERHKAGLAEAQTVLSSGRHADRELIESALIRLKADISNLEAKEAAIEEQIEKERNTLAELNSQLSHISESLANLNSLTATCPVCDSPISDSKKQALIEKKLKIQSEIRAEIEKVMARISDGKAIQTEFLKALKEKAADRAKLEHQLQQIEELKERISDYSQKLAILEQEKARLQADLSEISMKDLRTNLQQHIGLEREVAAKLAALNERITDRQISLADLKKRLDVLNNYKSELAADERAIDQLTKFIKILRLTQAQLRDEFVKTVNWIMDQIWFTVFLAWLIKFAIVRYGGLKLFQKFRPLFLGLILGQFTCNGFWIVIDAIAGGRGNQIFWI